MPQLLNHRSASFLKSSLSSMTRTRVMSPGRKGGMRILCKAPRTIHRERPAAPAMLRRRQLEDRGRYPGDLPDQSSVNASQAMLSQAMLSQAMLSQAMLSQAMLSQAMLSQ